MAKVMVTIQAAEGAEAPTLSSVCERYGLNPADLDQTFGVVEIDPSDHLYVVLAEPEAAATMRAAAVPSTTQNTIVENTETDTDGDTWRTEGPYSNPRIASFGPPKKDEDE